MENVNFTPLAEGQPRENTGGGIRGGSRKTRFYREQLQANPGKWYIWKSKSPHGSDTGQALRTLVGIQVLTGLDRSTFDYEATAQKQDDGTYTTFVRYTGNATIAGNDGHTPLVAREDVTVVASAPIEQPTVVTNPFGVSA